MTNYYRINVSKDGKYLFATEGGGSSLGITDYEHARQVVNLFKEKFTESEGYKISVTYYKCHGEITEF